MIFVSISFSILQREIFYQQSSRFLKIEIIKSIFSSTMFLLGIIISWYLPYVSVALYFIAISPWVKASGLIEWIVGGEDKNNEQYQKMLQREKKQQEKKIRNK